MFGVEEAAGGGSSAVTEETATVEITTNEALAEEGPAKAGTDAALLMWVQKQSYLVDMGK